MIFFDLDGPILDVSERHYRVYCEFIQRHSKKPISKDVYWTAKRRKISDGDILQKSGDGDHSHAFSKHKIDLIESSRFLAFDTLQIRAMETIETLRTKDRLVLVTLRRSPEALLGQLAKLDLLPKFEKILSGYDDEKQGWLKKVQLITSAGYQPGGSDTFIGDTETDIKAGKHFGMRTIAVTNGIRELQALQSVSPDKIVDSIETIPNLSFFL